LATRALRIPASTTGRQHASTLHPRGVIMAENEFECFCGDRFGERELLIVHNVDLHGMERDESQRKVDEKYPVS
jgi:hypothetical protein